MNVKELTRISVLCALIFVTMLLLNFNIFGSALHLGSLLIVVISLVFPRKEALIASSIAPTLFDLFTGYALYAPFTLVARFLLSYVVSLSKDKNIYSQVLFSLLGGIIVIAVYFISYLIFTDSFTLALYATIPDFLQLFLTLLGVFIAIPVKKALENLI